MKKKLGRLTSVLFILFISAIFTGCSFRYSVGTGVNFLRKEDAKEYKVDKAVVKPITTIVIDTDLAEVQLIEADDYYVEIDYLYWNEEPEYSLEEGKLYFNDKNAFPNSYSINFHLNNKITIYLPEATELKDLVIKNSSGDVSISSFVANDLNLSVSYGDLLIKNAAAREADISLSSGKSSISKFQAGKLKYSNSYGNAEFTDINTGESLLASDAAFQDINISMSSGNVDINNLSVEDLDISNSYGDVTCTDITAEDASVSLSSGRFKVKNAEFEELDVSNSYGDVDLNLIGLASDYIMNLSTSYGKIQVSDKKYEDHIILDYGGSKRITADLSSGNVKITFQ